MINLTNNLEFFYRLRARKPAELYVVGDAACVLYISICPVELLQVNGDPSEQYLPVSIHFCISSNNNHRFGLGGEFYEGTTQPITLVQLPILRLLSCSCMKQRVILREAFVNCAFYCPVAE